MIDQIVPMVRSLARTPGTSLTVLATSALAIGAATLGFTVVDGVLLRPLPYPESDRIVDVRLINPDLLRAADTEADRALAQRFPVSFPVYDLWREDPALPFTAVGAWARTQLEAPGGEGQPAIPAVQVTPDVFDVLGVMPAAGRTMGPGDGGVEGPPVAVLTYGAWQSRFGGDPDVVGRSVDFGSRRFEVIGVMPRGFHFPDPQTEVLVSFSARQRSAGPQTYLLDLVGRLPDDMSPARAQEAMEVVGDRTTETLGWTEGTANASVVGRLDRLVGGVRDTLLLLFATVGVLLLVACANIGNILLVQGTAREREYAVRASVGAAPRRLLALPLIQSLALVVTGGLVGLGGAWLLLDPLLNALPDVLPRRDGVGLNMRVAAFAGGVSVFAAVLAAMVPGWKASRTAPVEALRERSRGAGRSRRLGRLQRGLVVTEVAAALLVVVTATLLTMSYLRLSAVDLGYDTEGLITVGAFLPPGAFPDPGAEQSWRDQVRERVRALPGVEGVTFASGFPHGSQTSFTTFEIRRADGSVTEQQVTFLNVDAAYFDVLGVDRASGAVFQDESAIQDDHGVIVNRVAAARYWPGDSSPRGWVRQTGTDGPWQPVIGVVENTRGRNPADAPGATLYFPLRSQLSVMVGARASQRSPQLADRIEEVVGSVHPAVRTFGATAVDEIMKDQLAGPRFRTGLLVLLAAITGFLAILGVYALVAFEVAQRRTEIGIRIALGARPATIVRDVLGRGIGTAAAGTALGLVGMLALAGINTDFLFQVEPREPAAFALGAALVLAVALLASTGPARRALRSDPAVLLNTDDA